MRAAVLHTAGWHPSYARASGAVAGARVDAGPGDRCAGRAARPAVRLGDVLLRGARQRPTSPAAQGVGLVEASDSYAVGSRVWFYTPAGMRPSDGSLAELCLVPDADVVRLEAAVPDELAAALGLSGVAAWMALSWRARLQEGERSAGARRWRCGRAGRHRRGPGMGAATVVAVARTTSVDRARAAGADLVVPLGEDVDALAAVLTEAGPFDVVLDPVWGHAATAAARALAVGGRLVNLGGGAGDQATFQSSVLRSRSAAVLGYTNNALTPEQRASAISAVLGHAAAGRIRLAYDVHPLADVEEAWTRQADGRAHARCVLVPG